MSAALIQIYYRELCGTTRDKLGGPHSPVSLIRSFDFAEIEILRVAGAWDEAGEILNREVQALERGGADLIILATNSMLKLADQIMRNVCIPLVQIADATAGVIKAPA